MHESNPGHARHSDLMCAFAANVRTSAGAQLLAIESSQNGKHSCHWLDYSEGGKPRLQKLFSEDSMRRPEVIDNVSVVVRPSSGAITNAILHGNISPFHPSPAS